MIQCVTDRSRLRKRFSVLWEKQIKNKTQCITDRTQLRLSVTDRNRLRTRLNAVLTETDSEKRLCYWQQHSK